MGQIGAPAQARFVPARLGGGNGPIYGRYQRLGKHTLDENHFPVLRSRDGQQSAGLAAYVSGA